MIVVVGGSVGWTSGSERRCCVECGAGAYFSQDTLRRIAAEPGPAKFICMACVPADDVEIVPYNEEQIATIQAAGIDLTGDQINTFAKERMGEWIRRQRKP